MNNPKKLTVFAIAALLTLLLSACNISLAADVTPPPGYEPAAEMPQAQPASNELYPLVAPDLVNGKAIFSEKCAPCHGDLGLGDGENAADLPNPVTAIGSPEVARLAIPASWYDVVTQGNLERFMPPFPSLNDRQRWDVVSYALQMSVSPDELANGQELYNQNCAGCHGDTGKGDGINATDLSSTVPDITDHARMASLSAADLYQVISAGKGEMPAYQSQIDEQGLWALAGYIRSLSFAKSGEQAVEPDPTASTPITSTNPVTATLETTPLAGMVQGLVTNLSGSELPTDAEITLHAFDDMQLVYSSTVTLQADGSYTFPNVDLPDGRMLFTTLQHQGVTYGSDVSTIAGEMSSIDLPIGIYDSTSDTSALKIDRLHLFFEPLEDGQLRVAELFIISNTGDKTVVPPAEGQPSLEFKLPAGATDLEFQDGVLGGRFIQTADGFGDTATIYPGTSNYQVLLAYNLPFKRSVEINQGMNLPVDAVVVMLPEGTLSVKGEGLEQAGTRNVENINYQMYNLANLAQGEELSLSIGKSFSLSQYFSGSTMPGLLIGMAALGLVLVIGGIWMYQRSRKLGDDSSNTPTKVDPSSGSSETPESLMDAILALDDLYQSGNLPEEAYLERRGELKARLKELLGQAQV